MAEIIPTVSIAVFTVFIAIFTGLVWWTNCSSFHELIRPELVIDKWERADQLTVSGRPETKISILSLVNVGKGSAVNIWIDAVDIADDNRPIAFSPTVNYFDIIAPTQSLRLKQTVSILWNNIALNPVVDSKYYFLKIELSYQDSRGIKWHSTPYNLHIAQDTKEELPNQRLQGVRISRGKTKSSMNVSRNFKHKCINFKNKIISFL